MQKHTAGVMDHTSHLDLFLGFLNPIRYKFQELIFSTCLIYSIQNFQLKDYTVTRNISYLMLVGIPCTYVLHVIQMQFNKYCDKSV